MAAISFGWRLAAADGLKAESLIQPEENTESGLFGNVPDDSRQPGWQY